ncbi:superoxide dismutase family protein [Lysobacter sp. N42]|uniref:superoxide dismutase family protein n=1 Tax=Lysobacter sp. N42 TaxID=2545719 RepID=UPI00104F9314|nr:superoxide dismutase family protein [Lysobacter sp. N42]TCZ83613.1 superoxide dismutase family protein [Lysobacter sp. N42]
MPRVAFLLLAATLAGCASTGTSTTPAAAPTPASTPPARSATVNLAPASGSLVSGKLSAMPMAGGVHFTGEIGGLVRNATHAIHVHEKGDCSAADASSAGGHFNPTGQPHGRPDAGAHHAGDMPNITADANGVARVNLHVQGISLGGAAATDIVGRALVVHAQPDDYATQPSGNSGARIACGVVTAVR